MQKFEIKFFQNLMKVEHNHSKYSRMLPISELFFTSYMKKVNWLKKKRWNIHEIFNLVHHQKHSFANEPKLHFIWLSSFPCSFPQTQAHQAILSACSPYFESIFIENTHPHPIMYMGNVDFEDLKAIIEYIYKGEVNIAQNSLQKFLKTAVDLQVSFFPSDVDLFI